MATSWLPNALRFSREACKDRCPRKAAPAKLPDNSPGADCRLAPTNPTEELYMRARLLIVVLVFMTVLPVLSPSDITNATNRNSFTALAGHTEMGGYCDDGTPGCISGPAPLARSARRVGGTPVSSQSSSNSGSTARIIVLDLLRWIVGTF
jgi:hypothetical protein